MDFDVSEIKEEFKEIQKDIERIIYMWRRYEGKRCNFKIGNENYDKVYGFGDLNSLDYRIKEYFENPELFDWNKGKCIFKEEEDDEVFTEIAGSDEE